METPSRYDALVNSRWPWPLPPITRIEAQRASQRLIRHFGKRSLAGGHCAAQWDLTRNRKPRQVWTAARAQKSPGNRGWARLVHDCSHIIFAYRHPTFRPHDGGHAQLEAELQDYVLTKHWLDRRLLPTPQRLSLNDKRANKLARCEASIVRWEAKYRRAENALRKLRRRKKVLTAVLDAAKIAVHPECPLPFGQSADHE